MIVKIELIVLSIIAILSFVTGVVINIIDMYKQKNIDKVKSEPEDEEYEQEIIDRIKRQNAYLDDKTIIDIDIPRVKEKEIYDAPVIIETLTLEEANKK